MRIIYFGTPDFAAAPLKTLANNHEIAAVVTQPDAPSGRGKKLTPPPVKLTALELNIPVLQPAKAREGDFCAVLAEYAVEYAIDAFVVAAYGQILPQRLLDLPKFGAFNVHASLLPKYRGASPIQAAILNDETETGVTIMKMDKGLDTGDMVLSGRVGIAADDTAGTLGEKLSELGSRLISVALPLIESGRAEYVKQDGSLSTYAPLIKNEDALINWQTSAQNIVNLIRAMNPSPGAYSFTADGERIKIWGAKVADGKVLITEVQAAGGKRQKTADFLRGRKIIIEGGQNYVV